MRQREGERYKGSYSMLQHLKCPYKILRGILLQACNIAKEMFETKQITCRNIEKQALATSKKYF
jgi:TRAP-type mannitol/chloroaromatic compound transport system permease large subunit